MIIPEKIYTDNPYVDNILYYAKLLALNCVVKDHDEALKYETVESVHNADILIACIEGRSTYEMFDNIPEEILEKYIPAKSNIDLYASDPNHLELYFRTFPEYKRQELFHNISQLSRTIFIDHYNIMMNYLPTVDTDVYAELYNNLDNTTIEDLFNILPLYTRSRIIKQYLNFAGADIDNLCEDYTAFIDFINSRSESTTVNAELNSILRAMRSVFKSHYEILQERDYLSSHYKYKSSEIFLKKCQEETATYEELYNLIPIEDIDSAIDQLGIEDYVTLANHSLETLKAYFTSDYAIDGKEDEFNTILRQLYIDNYNPLLSTEIYLRCKNSSINYWELSDYIPEETVKIILSTYIPEVTNIEQYSKSKAMLNNYLGSLPADERNLIKNKIAEEMVTWYPENYVELNRYYRALIGLPPMNDDGYIYQDTLRYTYCDTTKELIDFKDRFIEMIPETIYPASHWEQPLYKMDGYDISILREYGVLDEYFSACKASNKLDGDGRYTYFTYLGDDKLDIYTCRKAIDFQLIYVPTVDDNEAKEKFIDSFNINRDYILRTVYTDAYAFCSDYYNKFIIIFILINTIMDMLANIPEYIIDREVFDARCIKYLFESFGIPYYSEIPLKYQRAMLKNLNILIKYKSSTRNMVDICSLFGFNDVKVFNYYMFRDVNTNDVTGEYLFDDEVLLSYDVEDLYIKDPLSNSSDISGGSYRQLSEFSDEVQSKYLKTIKVNTINTDGLIDKVVVSDPKNVFVKETDGDEYYISIRDKVYLKKLEANTKPADLKFIKVPINDSATKYKNNDNYIENYDEVVYSDDGNTWDGGLDHYNLKQQILDQEFNIVRTKYVSIETVTEMSEMAFQVSYFYNMLFDNLYSEDALTIQIPYLRVGRSFKFMDIICYLFALMYLYNGLEDNIMYSPSQILYVKGYNFNDVYNAMMNDETLFQQNDPATGYPLADIDKYNIFSINDRIAEDGYDYRKAFKDYNMLAFNLDADIDELDQWLQHNFQMSLEDFAISGSEEEFGRLITYKDFFSLRNSNYQKNIFVDNVSAVSYPILMDILFSYNYGIIKKDKEYDYNDNVHYFIYDGKKAEIIDDQSDTIFILDYNTYITMPFDTEEHRSIYYKYIKDNGNYLRVSNQPYVLDSTYSRLFNNKIFLVDSEDRYVFSTDKLYSLVDDVMTEISTDNICFYYDLYEPSRYIFHMTEFFIKNKYNEWVINPDKAYVKTSRNGEITYIPVNELDEIDNVIVSEDECYIRHSDGHFIKFTDTDYYRRHDNEFIFTEEDLYIVSPNNDEPTDWEDNGIYYVPLSNYYSDNNIIILDDKYYVLIGNDYIREDQLTKPDNCYFKYDDNDYRLVINYIGEYDNYSVPFMTDYILVLQDDYKYSKLAPIMDNYFKFDDENIVYHYNSDNNYALYLKTDSLYSDYNRMIVLSKKYLSAANNDEDIDESQTVINYDAETTDNKWDENDWFYSDPSYEENNDIGMNGENKWYYKKPGDSEEPESEEDEIIANELDRYGFVIEADGYIGNIEVTAGEKYYMSFDIETNFTSKLRIYNEADPDSDDRIYLVTKGEPFHVSHVFVANDVSRPRIFIVRDDYDDTPINIGDYVVIENIRFMRSYSDNFIAQDIPSYEKLQELYRTNEAIYKHLCTLMTECEDYDTYQIYSKIYESLMLSKYNKEAFKIGDNTYAKTYTDFMEVRDAVLFENLQRLKTLDVDAMKKEIADNIIEITYALDEFINVYSYGYLYSYFPAVSANYVQQYISKVINFFKSWKTHLLGINTIYKFDSEFDNTVKILYDEQYRIKLGDNENKVHIYDEIHDTEIDTRLYDKYEIKDKIRIISRDENVARVSTNNDMHIILSDDSTLVYIDDNDNIHISSSDEFHINNDNELHMINNINEEYAYVGQTINEINHFTASIGGNINGIF